MSTVRMHADEVDVDASLVRGLLAEQFPEWADLPIEAVFPRGTDNRLFRLGDDMVVRLPCRAGTVSTLVKEREWLPRLGPHLPLAVPVPLALGEPGDGYAFTWSIYRWLDGENAIDAPIADFEQAADDLAGFLVALEQIDTSGAPPLGRTSRGAPLAALDPAVRGWIESLGAAIDGATVATAWEEALEVPEWEGPPVWVHADLDARNPLVRNGRLVAVVDFGTLGVGDPACDVAVALKVLPPNARERFRNALAVDGATWARARGWVLCQALGAAAYYTPETNAVLYAEGRRWLGELGFELR